MLRACVPLHCLLRTGCPSCCAGAGTNGLTFVAAGTQPSSANSLMPLAYPTHLVQLVCTVN